MVWGIEGDIDFSTIKGSETVGASDLETKNSWLATARARLGYAGFNNWLPYITGGAAGGDIKATNSTTGSATKTKIGWTAGAGVEYALWSNWSVKADISTSTSVNSIAAFPVAPPPTMSASSPTSCARASTNRF